MNKIRTKGPKVGNCNICGIFGQLTYDHVPPKGSFDPQKVKIKNIFQSIDTVDSKVSILSQNGVKFRSLCKQCNNQKLGGRFDPSLNKFSHEVGRIIHLRERKGYIFTSNSSVNIQPQRVARAVIGHLLAAEIRDDMTDTPRSAPMVNVMRQYFLDETIDFPEELNLYFWPYVAKDQVILRGVGLGSSEQFVIGDFLKYLPLAFWLTYQVPTPILNVLKNREILVRGCDIDTWKHVSIPTKKNDTFRPNWPEFPDDVEILLLNNQMCFHAEPA